MNFPSKRRSSKYFCWKIGCLWNAVNCRCDNSATGARDDSLREPGGCAGKCRLLAIVLLTSIWPALTIAETTFSEDPVPQFLRSLKAVASQGNFFDVAYTARLLNISFKEDPSDPLPNLEICEGNERQLAIKTTRVAPPENGWYKDLPTGIFNLQIPGNLVNRPKKFGSAAIRYEIEKVAPMRMREILAQAKSPRS